MEVKLFSEPGKEGLVAMEHTAEMKTFRGSLSARIHPAHLWLLPQPGFGK